MIKEETTVLALDGTTSTTIKKERSPQTLSLEDISSGNGMVEVEEAVGALVPAFKCSICKNGARMNVTEFKAHYQMEHEDVKLPITAKYLHIYICDICSKSYKKWYNFKSHMDIHDKIYDCESCGAIYRKLLHYVLHMRVHSDGKLMNCIYCDYATSSKDEIAAHLKTQHKTTSHKYVCKICEKGFELYTWFKEHGNYHTGEKPFKCELCDKSFLYTRHLSSHKIYVHKESVQYQSLSRIPSTHKCKTCGKEYKRRGNLVLHMNNHAGLMMVCDVCGKQLSNAERLKFHMRVHTGHKPHKCNHCEKAFSRKAMLDEHERIHTGVRPFKCQHCKKSFSQRTSLVIHIRGHTGERPYSCNICGKTFTARAMLNVHFKKCRGY